MIQTVFEAYVLAVKLMAIYMTGMFIMSLLKRDNSIVDTAYGIGFVMVVLATFFVFAHGGVVQILVSTLIIIWGLRLSLRIYIRNKNKPEDFRYKKWRDEWKWFKTRSFFQVYVLQGCIIIGVSSVAIVVNSALVQAFNSLSVFEYLLLCVGASIWIVGFIFEAVGDYQLDCFIKKQTKEKKDAVSRGEQYKPAVSVMSEGLWGLTRHPNYFGEVVMWWGLWLIACTVPYGVYTILSPLTITYLLLKVSGIPMLEEKYKGNPEYDVYKLRTNAFFPWKPKS